MNIIKYIVKGEEDFPVDMLRYDNCWPYDSQAAARITSTFEEVSSWEIVLASYKFPTIGRWNSFSCTIEYLDSR